uniref:60S ribosomal protein L29 n=2 Tax=Canis lupus familiaris TaxID=9615 RepID=A0A8C0SMM1_CANLF
MAKFKNHTMHNQSQKWHRNGIKKLQSQRYKSLKRVDPKFLRNMWGHKASNVEASVCQCEDGRTGMTPGLLSAWA